MLKNSIKIAPGFLLAFLVAILAKGCALMVPSLGAATFALFLGILLGNIFFKQPQLQVGTKFSESKLLECSIFLLGGSLTFQTIAELGIRGIGFILLQMSWTIFFTIVIGKRLKFSEGIYLLMASGNAVCGSSAIAATAPVIEASDEDKGLVITIVNLMGTVLMLVLPIISWYLYSHQSLESGALIGGTLQSVGQVVASGSLVSPKVTETAAIFKIMRILFLVVVVFIFGRIHEKDQSIKISHQDNEKKQGKVGLPWYIIGFFVVCSLNSLGMLLPFMTQTMAFFGGWFEIIALAAIGLRLDFSVLLKQGRRFAYYGLAVGSGQIISAIILIRWLLR